MEQNKLFHLQTLPQSHSDIYENINTKTLMQIKLHFEWL